MRDTKNPIFSNMDTHATMEATNVATISGIFTKSLTSIIVFIVTLMITMSSPPLMALTNNFFFVIIGTIFIFSMIFKIARDPKTAKSALYIYAVFEGMVLASFILVVNTLTQSNVGLMAGVIVVVIFFTMLFVYASFPNFYDRIAPALSVLMFATFGILMLNLIFSIFGAGIKFGSTLDLIVTLGLAIMASFSYLRDFRSADMIVQNKMPKEYEYVVAFGLLTTTIWLYVEIVRLIAILSRNND